MRLLSPLMAVSLYAAATATCMGAELAYTCKVTHVYDLSEDGSLQPFTFFESDMVGSYFSVSRLTGEIIGEVVPTLMAKSTRVVNRGSSEYSFKAVADFGDQYQLLEVQEFRVGVMKPFVASSMGGAGIVTGVCR